MKDKDVLKGYKNGKITIEAKSLMPEKFINLLWKNGVIIYKASRADLNTVILTTDVKSYRSIKNVASRTGTKLKVIKRKGLSFFILKSKRKKTLFVGVAIFFMLLYISSKFIWSIEINTDDKLTPYEIRTMLLSYGIKAGISKGSLNVYDVENKLLKDSKDILWLRVRMEGSKLEISAKGKNNPPIIISEDTPCNIVAKRDAEILRVYTSKGTAVVKSGDIVKKGQLLVKGEQGKQGETYAVHSEGEVIGKTYYEEDLEVQFIGTKKVRTGKEKTNIYLNLFGKKLYLKKTAINFNSYDKIVDSSNIVNKEKYYELKEVPFKEDPNTLVKVNGDKIIKKLELNLDSSVKILDRKIDYTEDGDNIIVRVILVVEEKIGETQIIE